MNFPEAAIRKRLAAGYRHQNKRNGRGVVMFDEAVEDVKRCLQEINHLLEDVDYRIGRISQTVYARAIRDTVDVFNPKSTSGRGKTAPVADAAPRESRSDRSSRKRPETPSAQDRPTGADRR